ncbi:MAG TPA: acylphosphatase [Cyclobacteriaceae bacterium]|nr:acylphosphatase [Cyclobacteriaceae bacterium]
MHLAIRVTGKVQGVFYRASTRDKARSLGLCGFVKNEDDGSVYIEAEGDKEKLDQFVNWCKQGPPNARVDKVEVAEREIKNFSQFEIKRDFF